ncbi:heterokaryon incompatibility protein-domain-containing protein [Diaporthe sp. PMI_573]|nr:heterokaryon incompatibility protein-domain-containing protein [Diaporthaceae sp. PMI_573]
MRLLDVHSVAEDRLPVFHELPGKDPISPLRYVVLSHTWGKRQDNEDVVFDDIPRPQASATFTDLDTQLKQWQEIVDKKKAGFCKITNACRVAREMGFDYIWIDSCCIDKSKSAELSESINSMYRWYQTSEWCIVYLEDLEPDGDLRQCRWFKRGWTLQELVAPSKVTFHDSNWAPVGERCDTRFCESLSSITGIDMSFLQGGVELGALSVAQKMSWANGRETTIPEDGAYSLMGIFDVNMPLVYGEGGPKAFRRLQEAIIGVSSDLTIFAWDPNFQANAVMDAFASRPDEFTAHKDLASSYQSQHFTITNKGIRMKTVLWRIRCDDGDERLMMYIGTHKNDKCDIGIVLRKVGPNMYMRRGNIRPFVDEQVICSIRSSKFYLVSPHASTAYHRVLNTSRERAIWIPVGGLGNYRISNTAPEYAWDYEDRLFFNNWHWGGSDWRAIELVGTGLAPDFERRFIALFDLNTGVTPTYYLLRWRRELAFIFNRRHQTETTRLGEFYNAVKGATNELDIESDRARLSIWLTPTSMDKHSVMCFRMELQEVPSVRAKL